MENEIFLHVEGMHGRRGAKKIQNELALMPGIEMIEVNPRAGTVSVTGGDLDQLQVVDIIESLGFTAFRANPGEVK